VNLSFSRTTKSARRKIALTLLGALAVLAMTSFAVFAAAQKPDFSLGAAPSSQTVAPGAAAVYSVTVTRTNGFADPVTLTAGGLPTGTTATWKLNTGAAATGSIVVPSTQTTATLTLQTASSTPTGNTTVTITGTSGKLTHSTSVVLSVQTTSPPPPSGSDFAISGGLPATKPLSPGIAWPLDLTISNPFGYTLKLTNLTVQIDNATSKAACSGTTNYKIVQYRAAYPINVPANAVRTLSQLGIAASDQPQVKMIDLATNQDACKGAALTLRYSGTATK
jgi:hypothetical protein